MRVLVVSGIWPPAVGGPASHAPELAERLLERGHSVEVVVSAPAAPARERYAVRWVPLSAPRGVRHVRGAAEIARRSLAADVVYATGMIGRSALATTLTRRPLVVKLTSDPSYERSLRYGLGDADFERYQRAGSRRVRALRTVRDWSLRRAAHVVVPSEALRELAIGWGVGSARITLLPNPVAAPDALEPRDELRRRHGFDGPTLVYAGRLAPQKRLDVALRAVAEADGVSLVIAGDGPEEESLRALAFDLALGERVRFAGPLPRAEVFALLRAADAAVLSSNWENFPHMAVEALAVGTPVLAVANAITRYVRDAELRASLRRQARSSVEHFAPEQVYGRLEQILEGVTR